MDIDYEELQNFKFVQSYEEEDNAEFSVVNPNSKLRAKIADLDLEDESKQK